MNDWSRERGKEERKGRKEGRKEHMGEGEELILFTYSGRLTVRWHGCVWRKAGGCCDPADGRSVSLRCCSYTLIVSPVPQSTSSVPWRVSLLLKRFFSLPRLNWWQLNTQMYYSSLGCWRGNIFWKIWQLSITAQRNWRKEERATKEAPNRIFKGHSLILCYFPKRYFEIKKKKTIMAMQLNNGLQWGSTTVGEAWKHRPFLQPGPVCQVQFVFRDYSVFIKRTIYSSTLFLSSAGAFDCVLYIDMRLGLT